MSVIGFSGIFSISNWVFDENNIQTYGAPMSVVLISNAGQGVVMSINITYPGSITFSYMSNGDNLSFTPFGYLINFSKNALANFGMIQGGTCTVNVSANDVFSFYIDSNSQFIPTIASTTVENFRFNPSITNFSISTKIFGETPFQITPPSSNSSGLFSYASSNLSVATIFGNTITIVGVGDSTITATQEATNNYTSETITTTFQVNQSTPTIPVIINNSYELLYFINTSSNYGNIVDNLSINYDLISSSHKVLIGNNIKIMKLNN